ncbi:MAG TPA: D-aminoacyl-tRNA deacylase [Phycisphaerae bacterium]|nr:D-aminoacyl-tRNA deacylase [Phycisphaerae bacterium]
MSMIAVVQRVSRGEVTVGEETVGQIGQGLVVLASVHADDTDADVEWTANKLATMRIFSNGDKYFDLDVQQVKGAILLVSNFTVAADTRSGRRPSLSAAAPPEMGRKVFDDLVARVRGLGVAVETGRFGAEMKVEIDNAGPVTFIVDSREARKA